MVHYKPCRTRVGILQIDCVCVLSCFPSFSLLSLSLARFLRFFFMSQLWMFIAHMTFAAVEAVFVCEKKNWYYGRTQLLYVCITYKQLHSHKNVLAEVQYGEYIWTRCYIQLNIKAKQLYFEAIVVFTCTCRLHTHEKQEETKQYTNMREAEVNGSDSNRASRKRATEWYGAKNSTLSMYSYTVQYMCSKCVCA